MDTWGTTKRSGLKVSSLFLLIVALTIALLLTACTNKESNASDSITSEYTETVINLPESEQYDYPETVPYVLSLEKTNSGKVWMTEYRFSPDAPPYCALWELDEDNSWKEETNIGELLGLDKNDYVITSSIAKNDKVLCIVVNTQDYSEGMRFYLIDSELENGFKELKIDTAEFIKENSEESLYSSVGEVFPIKNDRFIIKSQPSSLFVLDANDQTIKPIPSNNKWNVQSIAELDDTVYVLYQDISDYNGTVKFNTLDLSTGIPGELSNAAAKEFKAVLDEHRDYHFRAVHPTMKNDSGLEGERITLSLTNGIFEYSNDELKKIADAEGTVSADLLRSQTNHVFMSQKDFLLLSSDIYVPMSNKDKGGTPPVLHKYEEVASS